MHLKLIRLFIKSFDDQAYQPKAPATPASTLESVFLENMLSNLSSWT